MELGLAGQITDHVLNLIGTCCKNLRVLRIHGSFLCSANGWIKLFQELENLQEIRLEYAVKLSDLAIKTLVQSCSSLEVVELIECPNVTNEGVLEFSKLKGLSTLTVDSLGSIESPHLQKVVESHAKTLKSLSVNKYTVLNRNPQLSVELLDSITMCENLERLSLKFCPGLTAESENLVSLFTKLSSLKNVNLTGNTSVTDDVVNSLLNIHGESLEVLSLNGINELTERSLLLVSTKLPKIKELDVSWIRYILLIGHLQISCL